jgi:hypothetical protein
MRCLLDKVVARYAVQGLLKLAEGRELTRDELFTLDLLARAPLHDTRLFIAPTSANVIERLAQMPRYAGIIHYFESQVEVVQPTRYFTRWARRLRRRGFAAEDAAMLSLATFGTDRERAIIGTELLATYDGPMIRHWFGQRSAIQDQLSVMQRDIPAPYSQVILPRVLRPEQIMFDPSTAPPHRSDAPPQQV